MESKPLAKKFLIFFTSAIYIVFLVMNSLSAAAKPGNILFPNTIGNVSRWFSLDITPVGATFAIWTAIFIWTILWLLYTLVNVFRRVPSSDILSCKFFIAFNLNIIFIITWIFVWSRKDGVASFVVIVIGQILCDTAIGIASYDLKKFQDDNKTENEGSRDVWMVRILVQNGVLFYGTWTTIATLINLAVVLAYYVDVSTRVASIISLVFLAVLAITWFLLENVLLKKFTQYTFSAYIVLVIGLSGVVANGIFETDKTVGGLALALLLLAVVFLIVRCVLIILRHNRWMGCGSDNEEVV